MRLDVIHLRCRLSTAFPAHALGTQRVLRQEQRHDLISPATQIIHAATIGTLCTQPLAVAFRL
jgi:hypothetical protein